MKRLILSFGMLTLALAACQSGRSEPAQWVSTTASAPSDGVLWELALRTLMDQKFPVGTGADPSTMVAVTGWRNSLAPFKGEGYRERVRLKLEPLGTGKYKLSLHVEKETNEDIARPMDPSRAKWEEAPDDLEAAQVLLRQIEARLGEPLEIGARKPRLAERSRP